MLDDAVPLIKALHGIARLELCHHRRGQPEQSKSERIAFERAAINAGPDLGIEGVDPAATCVVVVAVGVVGERKERPQGQHVAGNTLPQITSGQEA